MLITVNRVGVRKWRTQKAPRFHGVEKAWLTLHGAPDASVDVLNTHSGTLIVHPLGGFGHCGAQINALCWLAGWSGHRCLLKKTKGGRGWTKVWTPQTRMDAASVHPSTPSM
jgi:hypothetical protein